MRVAKPFEVFTYGSATKILERARCHRMLIDIDYDCETSRDFILEKAKKMIKILNEHWYDD